MASNKRFIKHVGLMEMGQISPSALRRAAQDIVMSGPIQRLTSAAAAKVVTIGPSRSGKDVFGILK